MTLGSFVYAKFINFKPYKTHTDKHVECVDVQCAMFKAFTQKGRM